MLKSFRYLLILLVFLPKTNDWSPYEVAKKDLFQPQPTDVRGALLATQFKSLEALKEVISIEYFNTTNHTNGKPTVRLVHRSHGRQIMSVMETGINEKDIFVARKGNLLDKINLAFESPYFVLERNNFVKAYSLARRRGRVIGEGDIAFYDLAKRMLYNIDDEDFETISSENLSEKGYLNSFNHIIAQTFFTSLFSEELADFIGDMHERTNMPELVTGIFTDKQLNDLEKGPVDNYVDIINNEWGQELGKELRTKYNIDAATSWTPEFLATYLNEIQVYFSWAFQVGFKPFRPEDEIVQRFAYKLNLIFADTKILMRGLV